MMSSNISKHLSKEEIDQLFRFTERKLVHWYDLQVELVDHLACRIEEEISVDNALSFESALEKVYKEFGLFGFSKVVQEKEKQIYKAALRMWWKELVLLFSWPKVISTFVVALFLYQLTLIVNAGLLMRIFTIAYTISSIGLMHWTINATRKGRKLLLIQAGGFYMYLAVWFYLAPLWQVENVTANKFLFYAITGSMAQLASWQMFTKVKRKAIEIYPEAFAV